MAANGAASLFAACFIAEGKNIFGNLLMAKNVSAYDIISPKIDGVM
jgi:hypothetical protein